MVKPTLRTLSEATGLAVTTISRALSGDAKIAPATRERVARVAAEMGYVPDIAARRLRTGRTDVVALVLSPHEEIIGFRGSIIAGLSAALGGTGYQIMMLPYAGQEGMMAPVEQIVRQNMADGLVFARTAPDDPRAALLMEKGVPFVSHGRTAFGDRHAWCDYDNAAFARMAVARLAARGRRRAFLVQSPPGPTFAAHLVSGFEEAVGPAGMTGERDPAVTIQTPPREIHAAVTARMARGDAPDAFICPGEVAAMGVIAALTDLGLAVGREVDVIAKQTSPLFDQFRPRIDTIYEDLYAAGEAIGALLLRRMAGEAPDGLSRLMQPEARFRL